MFKRFDLKNMSCINLCVCIIVFIFVCFIYRYTYDAYGIGNDNVINPNEKIQEEYLKRTNQINRLDVFNDVVYIEGLYVAVGDGGRIIVSDDGYCWKEQAFLLGRNLNSVLWVDDSLIVVGDNGFIAFSNDVQGLGDPLKWEVVDTSRLIKSENLNHIYHDGNRFLIVGDDGLILVSNDLECNEDGKCFPFSEKGFEKRFEKVEKITEENLNSVWSGYDRDGQRRYVVVGDSGSVVIAEDGRKRPIDWRKIDSKIKKDLDSVIWFNNKFLAFGDENIYFVSDDGVRWDEITSVDARSVYGINKYFRGSGKTFVKNNKSELEEKPWDALARFFEEKSVAVFVKNGEGIKVTNNLGEWERLEFGSRNTINDVLWAQDKYVAVGENGLIMISKDGKIWTVVDSKATANLNSIANNGQIFLAVGRKGQVVESKDAISWKRRDLKTNNSLRNIHIEDDGFVVIGDSRYIFFVGENFTRIHSLMLNTGDTLYSIASNEDQVVAVGQRGAIFNGASVYNLRREKSYRNISFRDVIFGKNEFVAVGDKGAIIVSEDGYKWQNVLSNTGSDLKRITWTENKYVVVGEDGVILTSRDSRSWTLKVDGDREDLNCVYWNGKKHIFAGVDGKVMVSTPTPPVLANLGSEILASNVTHGDFINLYNSNHQLIQSKNVKKSVNEYKFKNVPVGIYYSIIQTDSVLGYESNLVEISHDLKKTRFKKDKNEALKIIYKAKEEIEKLRDLKGGTDNLEIEDLFIDVFEDAVTQAPIKAAFKNSYTVNKLFWAITELAQSVLNESSVIELDIYDLDESYFGKVITKKVDDDNRNIIRKKIRKRKDDIDLIKKMSEDLGLNINIDYNLALRLKDDVTLDNGLEDENKARIIIDKKLVSYIRDKEIQYIDVTTNDFGFTIGLDCLDSISSDLDISLIQSKDEKSDSIIYEVKIENDEIINNTREYVEDNNSGNIVDNISGNVEDNTVGNKCLSSEVVLKLPYVLKAGENPNNLTVILRCPVTGKLENLGGVYDFNLQLIEFRTKELGEFFIRSTPNNIKDNNINWAIPIVDSMVSKGVIKGSSSTTEGVIRIEPVKETTRAEFYAMIINAFKIQKESFEENFEDVEKDHWFANIITTAKKNKLIPSSLIDEKKIKPNKLLTREEIAMIVSKLMINYLGYEAYEDKEILKYGFKDKEEISDEAKKGIVNVYRYGIMIGSADGYFRPKENVIRVESLAVLNKLLN